MLPELKLKIVEREAPAEVFYNGQIYRKQMGTQPDFRLLRGFMNCLVIEAVLALAIIALVAIVKSL